MLKLNFEKWEETISWVKTYKTLLQKQDLSIEDYDNFLAIKSESIAQHQSLAGKRPISEEIKAKFMQAANNLFTVLLNKEKDVLHQRSNELDLETDRLKKENEDKKNLIFGVKKEIETASGEIKAIIKDLTPATTGSHLISMPGMIPPPPPAPMKPRNLQAQPGKSKQELPDSENKKSEMRISVDQLTAIKLKPARPPVMEKTITTESNESPVLQIRDLSRQLSEKFLSIESNRREGSINKPKPQISVTDIQARLNANSLKIYEKEQVIASLQECNKAQDELYNSLVLQREQLKKVKKEIISLKEEQQKKLEEKKQKQETLSITISSKSALPPPPPPPLPLARKTGLQQEKSKPVAQSNLTDKKKESVLSMEKGKLNNRDFLKQDLEKALVRRRVYLTDETNDENWQSDLDDDSSKRAFMIEQEKKKKEEQKQAIIAKYEKAAETHFQQHPAEFSAKKAVEIKIESLRKEIKLLSTSKLLVEFEDQIQQLIEKLKQKEEQVAINSSEVNEEPQESVPVPMQQETIIDAEPPVVSALLPAQTEELKEDNGCPILDEELQKASKRLADLPKGISGDLIKLRDYKIRKQNEINTISFSSEKETLQYENELITFYRKAIEIRLSNEAPEMQRQKLLQTAHDVFKPRDQGKRFFADVLMMLGCLVIAGLVVGVARKCTGNSFFFSNAPTRRESDFRALLENKKDFSTNETNEEGLLGASPAA